MSIDTQLRLVAGLGNSNSGYSNEFDNAYLSNGVYCNDISSLPSEDDPGVVGSMSTVIRGEIWICGGYGLTSKEVKRAEMF